MFQHGWDLDWTDRLETLNSTLIRSSSSQLFVFNSGWCPRVGGVFCQWHWASMSSGKPFQKQPGGTDCWHYRTSSTVLCIFNNCVYCNTPAETLSVTVTLSIFQVQVLIIFQPSEISLHSKEIQSVLQLSTYNPHMHEPTHMHACTYAHTHTKVLTCDSVCLQAQWAVRSVSTICLHVGGIFTAGFSHSVSTSQCNSSIDLLWPLAWWPRL